MLRRSNPYKDGLRTTIGTDGLGLGCFEKKGMGCRDELRIAMGMGPFFLPSQLENY